MSDWSEPTVGWCAHLHSLPGIPKAGLVNTILAACACITFIAAIRRVSTNNARAQASVKSGVKDSTFKLCFTSYVRFLYIATGWAFLWCVYKLIHTVGGDSKGAQLWQSAFYVFIHSSSAFLELAAAIFLSIGTIGKKAFLQSAMSAGVIAGVYAISCMYFLVVYDCNGERSEDLESPKPPHPLILAPVQYFSGQKPFPASTEVYRIPHFSILNRDGFSLYSNHTLKDVSSGDYGISDQTLVYLIVVTSIFILFYVITLFISLSQNFRVGLTEYFMNRRKPYQKLKQNDNDPIMHPGFGTDNIIHDNEGSQASSVMSPQPAHTAGMSGGSSPLLSSSPPGSVRASVHLIRTHSQSKNAVLLDDPDPEDSFDISRSKQHIKKDQNTGSNHHHDTLHPEEKQNQSGGIGSVLGIKPTGNGGDAQLKPQHSDRSINSHKPRRLALTYYSAFLVIYYVFKVSSLVLIYHQADMGICISDFSQAAYIALYAYLLYRTLLADSIYWHTILTRAAAQDSSGLQEQVTDDMVIISHSASTAAPHTPRLTESPPLSSAAAPHSPPSREISGMGGAVSPRPRQLHSQVSKVRPGEYVIPSNQLRFIEPLKDKGTSSVSSSCEIHVCEYQGRRVFVKRFAVSNIDEKFLDNEFAEYVKKMPMGVYAGWAAASHSNIIPVLGVSVDPPALLLVTEYCPNGSLYDALHTARLPYAQLHNAIAAANSPNVPYSPLRIALQVAQAMAHLHRFDGYQQYAISLKSANVMLDHEWNVKICDLGEGSLLQERTKTVAASSRFTFGFGTRARQPNAPSSSGGNYAPAPTPRTSKRGAPSTSAAWLPPEALAGLKHSLASDVYAFAVILWELLTHRHPFIVVEHQRVVENIALQAAHSGRGYTPIPSRFSSGTNVSVTYGSMLQPEFIMTNAVPPQPSLSRSTSDTAGLLAPLLNDVDGKAATPNAAQHGVGLSESAASFQASVVTEYEEVELSDIRSCSRYVMIEQRRPPLPIGCPAPLARLLALCWHEHLEERPGFDVIVNFLTEQYDALLPVFAPVNGSGTAANGGSGSSGTSSYPLSVFPHQQTQPVAAANLAQSHT